MTEERSVYFLESTNKSAEEGMINSSSLLYQSLNLPTSSNMSVQPASNMMHSFYPRYPALVQREKFIRNVYKEYLDPVFSPDGDTLLAVECGENRGILHLSRFCQGSKGPCIRFDEMWWTPNEFQYVSGRESAKDWKRSIRHQGKSLKLLIAKGILAVHPSSCSCTGCRISSPVNRGKLAGYSGKFESDHMTPDDDRNSASPARHIFEDDVRRDGDKSPVESRHKSTSHSPASTASAKSVIGSLLRRSGHSQESDDTAQFDCGAPFAVRQLLQQEDRSATLNTYDARMLQMRAYQAAKPISFHTSNFSVNPPYPPGFPQHAFSGMSNFDVENYQRSLYRHMAHIYQNNASMTPAFDYQQAASFAASRNNGSLPSLFSSVTSPGFSNESLASDNSETSSTPPHTGGPDFQKDRPIPRNEEETALDLTSVPENSKRGTQLIRPVKSCNPPPHKASKGLFGQKNRYAPYSRPAADLGLQKKDCIRQKNQTVRVKAAEECNIVGYSPSERSVSV